MRRVVKWLIPLLIIGFGLMWPVVFQSGPDSSGSSDVYDPVVITDYDVDIAIDSAGDMNAVETITTEFPGGRHGIFRYWDVANQNNPQVRQKPEITSVLLDGKPARYQMLWEDGERFRVAKIGDPDRTLRYGTHVFEIRYTIPGVLDPGDTGSDRKFAESIGGAGNPPAEAGSTSATSVFFWNVIAPSWNNRIERADVTVTLPAAVGIVQCSVGYGLGRACDDLTVDGHTNLVGGAQPAPRGFVDGRGPIDLSSDEDGRYRTKQGGDRIAG